MQLALRFRNSQRVDGNKNLFEERCPELLEWIGNPLLRNFLQPEDSAAETGLADVPMPSPVNAAPTPLFGGGADFLESLTFQRHPLNYRALRFRWNQAKSVCLAYPLEMHALEGDHCRVVGRAASRKREGVETRLEGLQENRCPPGVVAAPCEVKVNLESLCDS